MKKNLSQLNIANKAILAFIAITLLISFSVRVYAYEFPHSFWAMNDNYTAAVNSGNNANIVKYGKQILELMSSQPDGKEKRNVMVSRYNEVGKAYAAMGDYKNAANTFKTFYEYVHRSVQSIMTIK